MAIRSRNLRQLITIQQPVEAINSVGEPIYTWPTYAVRMGSFLSSGAKETYRLQQHFAEATHIINLRYDSLTKNITPKMRISYDSREFDIISSINVDEKNREIKIVCKELV